MSEPTNGEALAGLGCLVALAVLAVLCAIAFSASYSITQALMSGACQP